VPRVTQDRFRLLVLASLDGLPEWMRDPLDCVDFAIDDDELMDLGAY
jgi:hypothetical protein